MLGWRCEQQVKRQGAAGSRAKMRPAVMLLHKDGRLQVGWRLSSSWAMTGPLTRGSAAAHPQ